MSGRFAFIGEQNLPRPDHEPDLSALDLADTTVPDGACTYSESAGAVTLSIDGTPWCVMPATVFCAMRGPADSDLEAMLDAALATSGKPTLPLLRPIVRAWYALPDNGAGGSLHIVLDDSNIDDDSVRFCHRYAKEMGDDLGVKLAELLLRCSKTQRKRLASMAKT